MFDCCVDIGYEAQDTPGNADETMQWAADQKFSKLIIVTSSYHMPRSLTELGRVMPDVKLVPYPVVTQGFRKERWWRDFGDGPHSAVRVREVPALGRAVRRGAACCGRSTAARSPTPRPRTAPTGEATPR